MSIDEKLKQLDEKASSKDQDQNQEKDRDIVTITKREYDELVNKANLFTELAEGMDNAGYQIQGLAKNYKARGQSATPLSPPRPAPK